jgi:protein-disulfide isomerase
MIATYIIQRIDRNKGHRMKLKFSSLLLMLTVFLGLIGCNANKNIKKEVEKVIAENPEILIKAIEAKPAAFVEAFQRAVKDAQATLAKRREQEEKKKLEATFDNPLKPTVRKDEAIRGPKSAPITLVEYSDFECPFCSKGFDTVEALRQKYGNKIRFIYKHLPLSFHPQAMVAAKYFEAIRLQDSELAFKFHDEIFRNQRKLKSGAPFLNSIAKKIKVNMNKLKKDLTLDSIVKRIKEDQAEAAKFGMQGTPGFLINGVPVKGAYPASHFFGIVDELVKRGKLKL